MFYKFFYSVLFICLLIKTAEGQLVIGDCEVEYTILATNLSKEKNEILDAKKIFYLSGNKMLTSVYFKYMKSSEYFNIGDSSATLLKEIGDDKYIIRLSKEQWKEKNLKHLNAKFQKLTGSKKILNYACIEGQIILSNNEVIKIFYTDKIKPSTPEFPYLFGCVPGLVLDYELKLENGSCINFIATSVSLFPVPASVFDIPQKGYREVDKLP